MARSTPLSRHRIQAFREDFEKKRRQAEILRPIFELVGAYEYVGEENKSAMYGVNRLLLRKPFTDDRGWAPYSTWELAWAMADYRLRRFSDAIDDLPTASKSVHEWDSIRTNVMRVSQGLRPSVIVLDGMFNTDVMVDIGLSQLGRHSLSNDLQHHRVPGFLGGIPILRIVNEKTPKAYVVDLQRFARLLEYQPETSEFGVYPVIRDLESAERHRLVRQYQDAWNSEADPRPSRQWELDMRDQVMLTVFESAEISVRDARGQAGFAIEVADASQGDRGD